MANVVGRPSKYTAAEDNIIVLTANEPAEETNRQLVEAGYPERTPNAIKQRRYYLQQRGEPRVKPTGRLKSEADLTKALVRRRQLNTELERIAAAETRVRENLAKLNANINEMLEELRTELEDN